MSNSAPPGGFGSPPPPLPGYGTGGQTGPPRNYLVQAILTTLFCCLPFGIVSIVFAAQVNSKFNAGDVTGAVDASRKAKLWAWLSFGFGLAIILIAVASGRGIES